MAATAEATRWLKGRVKAVPSGDTLVIMGSTKAEIPPEKTLNLAYLSAPRLARRGGLDESFAWDSREFLRKLCIGKEITFRVEYTVPSIGREFGSIFLGDKNFAMLVVAAGWAKIREQGQQKGEVSSNLQVLLDLEDHAKQQGLGRWSRTPGASEASIRNLPPSAIGDPSNLDAMGLLAANKGRPMEAIVEQVRDGSTLRVYLVPDFQFVQVFIAGIQVDTAEILLQLDSFAFGFYMLNGILGLFHVSNVAISWILSDSDSSKTKASNSKFEALLAQLPLLNIRFAFKDLTKLQLLNLRFDFGIIVSELHLPSNLKILKLSGSPIIRKAVFMITELPNLKYLKLRDLGFEQEEWCIGDIIFCKLKFLMLEKVNITKWHASAASFPLLETLVIKWCDKLEGIPFSFADIQTLKQIKVL